MTEHPTPVVMVSAHTETGSKTTLQALARGAVDFVPKPDPEDEMDVAALADDLIETVETASNATVSAIDPNSLPGNRSIGEEGDPADSAGGSAASDGGRRDVLPADLP